MRRLATSSSSKSVRTRPLSLRETPHSNVKDILTVCKDYRASQLPAAGATGVVLPPPAALPLSCPLTRMDLAVELIKRRQSTTRFAATHLRSLSVKLIL